VLLYKNVIALIFMDIGPRNSHTALTISCKM